MGGGRTDETECEEVADGGVAFGTEVDVFWGRKARLLGVGDARGGRELADEGVARGDGLAEGVEEDARLVHVPHQQVDAELAQHGDVELDVDRVGVEVARDLGRWQQASRLGLAHDPGLGLHHVDGVLAVLGPDARDEANVGPEVLGQRDGITCGNLVRVLIVKVDEVQGNLPPLLVVALEQGRLGKASHGKIEFPTQVPGIVHRCVHALGSLGRVRMAGVTGEKGAVAVVAEPARDSLADLVATKPLDVLPPDLERRHDVPGPLHDELLAELAAVRLGGALELDVEARHVALAWDDQDGAVLL